MAIQTVDKLFERVMTARKRSEIEIVLKEIGDDQTIGLDQSFGPMGCRWVAYGGSESNESTIGLASKAGRSLTERVTNGVDALLELGRLSAVGELPRSPSDAACDWYGRPPSGPKAGLFQTEDKEGDLSRSIAVVLADSGVAGAPTIDIVDTGIGLDPEEMPSTILSLQQGNKVKKRYLMGTFGQGGSSTLAFCDYTLIVSRDVESPEQVGFTIVRLVDPGEDFELDVYAFLTINGNIPVVSTSSAPLRPYADTGLKRALELTHGTLVRHIGFKLSGMDKGLSSVPGNLYHYLHHSMFDPLLPFRVIDIRGDTARDERVGGSRNRLMKYVVKGPEDTSDSGNISIIHHHEMEDIIPLGSEHSRIGVEYWVVEAKRKTKNEMTLRSSSNELFVPRGYPVVATLNGQNQGELSAKFIRDLGLRMVARHIVVHLDTSRTDRKVRRELFTTTREAFKEGPQVDNLMTTLSRIIQEDERLSEIEQELTDRLVNRDHRATSDKVKKHITRLLRDAGFSKTADGHTDESGMEKGGHGGAAGGGDGRGGGSDGGSGKTLPLPTKTFPQVTRWEFVFPSETVRVRLNGRASVLVETDADERFDSEGLITVEFEPPIVEVASVSSLRGGRKQWRLRSSDTAKVGDDGIVTAVLRTPNGDELRTAIKYEVCAPVDSDNKGARGKVPDFEVLPISPDTDNDVETWVQLWPQHEGASRSKKAEVAYKVLAAGDKTIVYYSTGFGPYVERMEKVKSKSKALAQLFEENYQIWIGYHAIIQLPDDQKADDGQTDVLEAERCRVAQVQLRVAVEMAEMMRTIARVGDEVDV